MADTEDTRTNKEFYFDDLKARMHAMVEECAARKIGFVALVEYEPGEFGNVLSMGKSSSDVVQVMGLILKTKGDMDTFLSVILASAATMGHDSAVLESLGIPKKPGTPTEAAPTPEEDD